MGEDKLMASQNQISRERLQQIIKEELAKTLDEAVDHAGIRDVVTGASKLLAAVEAFKATAPHAAQNAVVPHITELERVLEDMVSSPGSYVEKPKVQPKMVSLKPAKK